MTRRVSKGNCHEALRGLWALLPTPFQENLDLDVEGIQRVMRTAVEDGVGVIVSPANVGELASLTDEEYCTLIRTAAEEIGDEAILVSGVGHRNTRPAVEQAQLAESAGADMLLLFGPAFPPAPRTTQEGIYRHHQRVAESTELPIQIVIYTQLYTMELLERLIDIDSVVSCKDEAMNITYTYNLLERFGDRIAVISGRRGEAEGRQIYYHLLGAPGYYSNLVCFSPELAWEHWDTLQRGDYQEVMHIVRKLRPYNDLYSDMYAEWGTSTGMANMVVLKECMKLVGRSCGPVRPPLVPLTEEERRQVREALQQVGVPLAAE